MRRHTKIATYLALTIFICLLPCPVVAQELGKYAVAHGYRATTWEDYNSTGYTPAFGILNKDALDTSNPGGFNARYGGGATVRMSCGPGWTQGAGTIFKAVGTTPACMVGCMATCPDGAQSPPPTWGTCTQVCAPRWIAPYSNKGTVIGERASSNAIASFYASVGIQGPVTDLDVSDAKMILSLYDGLITAANSGGVTAPPVVANPDDPGANAIPITDRTQPCGLFQSTMSGALRWYRNLSAPPNCLSTTTTPGVPPTTTATSCSTWKAKVLADISTMPGECITKFPAGSLIFSTGTASTGATQFVIVP